MIHHSSRKVLETHTLPVLVRVSIVATKHHDQRQGAEERVYLTYTYILLFISEEKQCRNSNSRDQDTETYAEAMVGAVYWLAQPVFL